MNDVKEEQALKKRFEELSRRADDRGYAVYSRFLGLSEQETLRMTRLYSEVSLFGGFEGAERKVARFGSDGSFPIVCLKIQPVAMKFADKLTHRDFLGSLTGLGLQRELLGDIIIKDNVGYLFCLEAAADIIISGLCKVCHTDVKCSVCLQPPTEAALPDCRSFTVASLRADAVVSAVYDLPRSESSRLFEAERVMRNGRVISASHQLEDGSIVSVRGVGRFIFVSVERETRKGRLRILARVHGEK